MTALCELATVDNVQISIQSDQTFSLNLETDLMELPLYSLNASPLGSIKELLFDKWHAGELPKDPGEYAGISFVENPVMIQIPTGWLQCNITATLKIGQNRFLGELSSDQLAMMTGTGPEVEMPDIEEEWKKLDPEDPIDPDVIFQGITPY
jgi:hypothetical protein